MTPRTPINALWLELGQAFLSMRAPEIACHRQRKRTPSIFAHSRDSHRSRLSELTRSAVDSPTEVARRHKRRRTCTALALAVANANPMPPGGPGAQHQSVTQIKLR